MALGAGGYGMSVLIFSCSLALLAPGDKTLIPPSPPKGAKVSGGCRAAP